MAVTPYLVVFRPIELSLPSEEVDERHVDRLAEIILKADIWIHPIPVERRSGIVTDGNHRFRVAGMLGLRYLPCVPLDYNDARLSVSHWNTDAPFCVDRIRCRNLIENHLFPYKTTRHRFEPALPGRHVPLEYLR